MRLNSTHPLAILDLRDQRSRFLLFVCLSLFCIAGRVSAAPVLNILTQPQRLDAQLVEEFEASRKVAVRVEFVTSSVDYEYRIKSLPHSWDLVVAEEQRLVNLSLAKILKLMPDSVVIPPNLQGLQRRARANEDGRAYINLMADPMGLMYLQKTKINPALLAWEHVINPNLNPLWRSRVALFNDERLNAMAAALAVGVGLPVERVDDNRKVGEWLSQAKLQGRSVSLNSAITGFLAEKYVAGMVWQSDFNHASRYVKDLTFAVPSEGTYFERVGVGLVADCRNEALAIDFIKFIHEHRDQLAQRRGLLPLHVGEFQGSQVKQWRVFSDDVPLAKELLSGVGKIKKERQPQTLKNNR